MIEFETSLLRERFVIQNDGGQIEAASNRIACPLYNSKGELVEEFIIRGQNMHSCARMVSRLLQSYFIGGPLVGRKIPLDWEALWKGIITSFDKENNENLWIAIYHKGNTIFQSGEHHPFLEMIEKVAAQRPAEAPYEGTVETAENLFRRGGKNYQIQHVSHMAFLFSLKQNAVRYSFMIRGVNKANTLSALMRLSKEEQESLNPAVYMYNASLYLEALQMVFLIGRLTHKEKKGALEIASSDAKTLREARRRMTRLEGEIAHLEEDHKIAYRPERPDFKNMIDSAQGLS